MVGGQSGRRGHPGRGGDRSRADPVRQQPHDPCRAQPTSGQRGQAGVRAVPTGPGGDKILCRGHLAAGPEQVIGSGRLGEVREYRFPAGLARHEPPQHVVVKHRDTAGGDADVVAAHAYHLAGQQAAAGAERHQRESVQPGPARKMPRPGSQSRHIAFRVRGLRTAGRRHPCGRGLTALDPHQCLTHTPQPRPVGLHGRTAHVPGTGQDERIDALGAQPHAGIPRHATALCPHREPSHHVQQMTRVVASGGCGSGDGRSDLVGDRRPPLVRPAGTVLADRAGDLGAQCHRLTKPAGQAVGEGIEADLHGKECIDMVGGLSRKRPPRDLARDPQSWPHAVVDDAAADVVQAIARALADTLETQMRSLRQVAAGSEVNRQAIADLIAGRCWPDVATIARLENFLAVQLYPHRDGKRVMHRNRPSRSPGQAVPGTTK